jgi:hypothetical protein
LIVVLRRIEFGQQQPECCRISLASESDLG